MTAAAYEREALTALGLPHPATSDVLQWHDIGTTEIVDSPEACRAVIGRRLARVRRALAASWALPDAAADEIAAADFLSYGEYLDAVSRIHGIRERLQRIANTNRRKRFDAAYRDNLYFYAEHAPPSPREADLARTFDADRHTPDWPGYLAYLSTKDPALRRFFCRRLSRPMEALLVPCISTLLRRPGSSIRDLQLFMDDKRNGALVDAGCASPVPAHRDFFRYRFTDKQYDTTKAALFTRIQSLLNSPVLYRLLVGRSTVTLEEAVNGGKIVILALPKGAIGAETAPSSAPSCWACCRGSPSAGKPCPSATACPPTSSSTSARTSCRRRCRRSSPRTASSPFT